MRIGYHPERMREVAVSVGEHTQQLSANIHTLRALGQSIAQPSTSETALAPEQFIARSAQIHLVARVENGLDELERLARGASLFAEGLVHASARAEQHEGSLSQRLAAGLSSTGFVASIRLLAAHIDLPLATASTGVIGLFGQLLKPQRGPDFSAALLGKMIGLFDTKPDTVQVKRQTERPVHAPESLAELVKRIPPAEPGGSQIRIEQYQRGNEQSWIVYCAGTVSMSANSETEPWDMQSNLQLMAGDHADSLTAAQQAIAQAGIRSTDTVTYVGFSQGGMLAAELALSAPAQTTHLVTVGAPIANRDLTSLGAVITVEHEDDLVPALAGSPDREAADRVLVRARALSTIPPEIGLPAHNLERYAHTTMEAESAPNREFRAHKQDILDSYSGIGVGADWRASRVQPNSG